MLRDYQHNQKGRSLLEILAVLVIMAILTVGGLWMYGWASGSYKANVIYEDVLVLSEGIRNRGGATNKNIYDSTIGKKTRTSLNMSVCDGATPCPAVGAKTFEIKVQSVVSEACKFLKAKKWPVDKVARVKVDNRMYSPLNINCDGLGRRFDLTVIFWSNHTSPSERTDPNTKLCSEGCLDNCQVCQGNICKNNCSTGKICAKTAAEPDGECKNI